MLWFYRTSDNTEVWGKIYIIGNCKGFSVPWVWVGLGNIKKVSIRQIKDVDSGQDVNNNIVWTNFYKLWNDGLWLFLGLVTSLKWWFEWLDGSLIWFFFNSIILTEWAAKDKLKYLGKRFFGVFAKECLATFNKFLEWAQWLDLNDYMSFI